MLDVMLDVMLDARCDARCSRAAAGRRPALRDVGGRGKYWTQTGLFFAMKRKTTPLLPGLYICMFFPLQ